MLTSVAELPVTIRWGVTSAHVLLASNLNSSVEDVKTSMNVALPRRPAVMVAPILRVATCVAAHLVTSE